MTFHRRPRDDGDDDALDDDALDGMNPTRAAYLHRAAYHALMDKVVGQSTGKHGTITLHLDPSFRGGIDPMAIIALSIKYNGWVKVGAHSIEISPPEIMTLIDEWADPSINW